MTRAKVTSLATSLAAAAVLLMMPIVGTGCDQGEPIPPNIVRAVNGFLTTLNRSDSGTDEVARFLASDYRYDGLDAAEQAAALKQVWPTQVTLTTRSLLPGSIIRLDVSWHANAKPGMAAEMRGTGVLHLGYREATDLARFTFVRFPSWAGAATGSSAPTLSGVTVNGRAPVPEALAGLGTVAPGATVTVEGSSDAGSVTASLGGAQETATGGGSFSLQLTAPQAPGRYVLEIAAEARDAAAVVVGLRQVSGEASVLAAR